MTFAQQVPGRRKRVAQLDQRWNPHRRGVGGKRSTLRLRKAQYTTSNFPNVTVIGVRKNGMWKFVYQKRDYVGSTTVKSYRFKAVHTIR